MEFQTTQKSIKNNYQHVIKVGYCDLQYLLSCSDPVAYTVRREGWGSDIYTVDMNTAISTGYAPFGNIIPSYELTAKYDRIAADICSSATDYNTLKIKLTSLLNDFVAEAIANN